MQDRLRKAGEKPAAKPMGEFVNKRYHVDHPGEQARHRKGAAAGRSFDQAWSNVFLVGLRGSGKTTLAREAALRLNVSRVDTDEIAEEEAGTSIADLVRREGWESFRDLEQRVLRRVCGRTGQVVATGGGIVLRLENRRLMRENGLVFYLMASPDLLVQRLTDVSGSGTRPSMGYGSLHEELVACMQERETLYLETLHFMLQAQKPVSELTDDLLFMLGHAGG
jgi:shikimate kinase